MEKHHFAAQPARYKTDYRKSIFFTSPINYLTISETVNLYGTQFGTDKIAHFFQQGYAYYKIYNRAAAHGLAPEQAARKAVRWGQLTERTYYGDLISGVYSNADLFANYIGMKFYQGLTRQIKIGDATRPAILILTGGIWTVNERVNLREQLIKPFLTAHLDEALNPSVFIKLFGLHSFVRRVVRKQSCVQWLKTYPNFSQADFEASSRALRLLHGEDYGFKGGDDLITISSVCFNK